MNKLLIILLLFSAKLVFTQDSIQIRKTSEVCYRAESKYGKEFIYERKWYISYGSDGYELFDKEGHKIESVDYDEEGLVDSKWEYAYTIDGKLLSIHSSDKYSSEDSVCTLQSYTIYDYNDEWNRSGSKTFNPEGQLQYYSEDSYDSINNIRTSKVIYDDGKIMYTSKTYYFEEELKLIREEYGSWGGIDNISYTFWDTLEKSVTDYTIDNEGDTTRYDYVVFNEKNLPVKNVYKRRRSSAPKTWYFDYDYDKHGYWIIKRVYNSKRELIYIVKREIEYWN